MPLEDYKEIVGTAAAVCTAAQIFAPVFLCKDIVKQGNTKNVSSGPFIGGLGMSLIVYKQGLLLNDPAILSVNIFGFVLNVLYLSVFFVYCDDKMELIRNILKVLFGVGTIYGYTMIESPERLETTYNIIVTIIMFGLISAPLMDLKEIIANKDTGTLPFPMIVSGTVVTFLWLLYGIVIKNVFIQFQNVVAFLLCSFQLSLFVIYPSKPKKAEKIKKSQ